MLRAAALATIVAGSVAAPSRAEISVPLSNLLGYQKGTSLTSALNDAPGSFGAGATTDNLGVIRVQSGGLRTPQALNQTGTLKFNLRTGGAGGTVYRNTLPLPSNDSTFGGSTNPISTNTSAPIADMPEGRFGDCIGMPADSFVTFDLRELRIAGGMGEDAPMFFASKAGINDFAQGLARLNMAVIVSSETGVLSAHVNGRQIATTERRGITSFRGRLPAALTSQTERRGRIIGSRTADFSVQIPGEARYITLASLSLGRPTWGAQGVFGNASITAIPAPASAGVLALGGLVAFRRRRSA